MPRVIQHNTGGFSDLKERHTVANEIVTEAVEHDCDVIVFEDLTDIRKRLP